MHFEVKLVLSRADISRRLFFIWTVGKGPPVRKSQSPKSKFIQIKALFSFSLVFSYKCYIFFFFQFNPGH